MEENEFREKAKEFGYCDEDIQGMIDIVNNAKKEGYTIPYESFALIEQPQY